MTELFTFLEAGMTPKERAATALADPLAKTALLGYWDERAAAILDALTPDGKAALAAWALDEETLARAIRAEFGGTPLFCVEQARRLLRSLRGDDTDER